MPTAVECPHDVQTRDNSIRLANCPNLVLAGSQGADCRAASGVKHLDQANPARIGEDTQHRRDRLDRLLAKRRCRGRNPPSCLAAHLVTYALVHGSLYYRATSSESGPPIPSPTCFADGSGSRFTMRVKLKLQPKALRPQKGAGG